MNTMSMRIFFSCAALVAVAGCAELGEATVTVRGPGQVRSNPEGIRCDAAGGECAAQLGESYILSAQPNAGAHFDHWEGDALCSEGGRATLVIGRAPKGDLSCTAVFADGDAVDQATPL